MERLYGNNVKPDSRLGTETSALDNDENTLDKIRKKSKNIVSGNVSEDENYQETSYKKSKTSTFGNSEDLDEQEQNARPKDNK